MQLTILGNSSGGPFHGRHYTAQVLQVENHTFLIDCGEGTQMQIFKYRVKVDACNQIFISHLHGDHVFGLIGLLTNWSHKKRSQPLHIFSPPGLQELIETTIRVCGIKPSYEIVFQVVDPSVSTKIFENAKVEVWTIPLHHRSPTSGWLFREKVKPRNIRPEKIEAYNIHFSAIPAIKAGGDFDLPDGRVISNAELTVDPPIPLSYAFCSDTTFSEAVIEVVHGVDLLYHEATFIEENAREAIISFHSTAAQAAEVARRAGVKRLILGHISGRYADTAQHLAEARAVFENVEIAEEGGRWEVEGDRPPFLLRQLDTTSKHEMHLTHKEFKMGEKDKNEADKFVRISKFISQILRHRPEKIGLQLDEQGWAKVDELLEKSAAKGTHFDRALLQIVVDTNDKKRFVFSEDGLRVRASQGHSIDIDLGLKPQKPPETLWHGTAEKSLESIRKEGLRSMRRQHVHLSKDRQTAENVGRRHGKAVVLTVCTGEMARQKHKFYLSENGVWLTEEVPVEFLDFPE